MAAVGRIGRALRKVGATRSTAKKAAAKKAAPPAAKTAPATKAAAKKATPAKKAPAKKATPAKKAPVKKATPAKKAPAKKAPAKKTAAKKATPAKKAPAKKAPAESAPAKKAPVAKAVPVTKAAAPVKQAPAKKAPAQSGAVSVPKGSEWTHDELAAVRKDILVELAEMRAAYDVSMRDLDDLQRSSTDGAGDDQADAGSKTFEREQEQSIAANRFDLMTQYERALERIESGTYGFCESCGRPIPKARLKAFPAATLDVGCKQREERR